MLGAKKCFYRYLSGVATLFRCVLPFCYLSSVSQIPWRSKCYLSSDQVTLRRPMPACSLLTSTERTFSGVYEVLIYSGLVENPTLIFKSVEIFWLKICSITCLEVIITLRFSKYTTLEIPTAENKSVNTGTEHFAAILTDDNVSRIST
jgi:hypothetical protein